MMDQHIENMRATATIVFKPSLCYDNFYQTKMSSPEMTKEIETIIEKHEKTAASISPDDLTTEIIDKIKKHTRIAITSMCQNKTHNNNNDNDNDKP